METNINNIHEELIVSNLNKDLIKIYYKTDLK